jgi:DNA processing protein
MRVAPPAIFVKGAIEEIDRLAVGIVGPRVPTNYGMEVARMLARDFAPTLTVVSGAALGIDSAVHQEVLEHGGRTLAVLGCGIDQNYPARNEPLRRRIGEGREGALISIFPPGSRPLRGNFPQRNFVLAGLCLAVVVVEASATSGALVTARAAGEEGRPVYAVPGDITRRNSAGSNALLRDGATACTSATDVLADLQGMLAEELEMLRERRAQHGLTIAPATAGEDAPRSEADSPVEAMVLRVIQHSTISHDDLINQFVPGNMSMGDLSTALLMLELKGKIQQLPGRFYGPRL